MDKKTRQRQGFQKRFSGVFTCFNPVRSLFLTEKKLIDWHSDNPVDLASFGSPAEFFLPGRCPQLALFLEVVALLQLPLPSVASDKGVAVLVDAVAEVLTGHANAGSHPALKVLIVNKVPFLHSPVK